MSYIKVSGVRGRPGHALIEIGYALNVEPLRFTLQRVGADRRYLGGDGRWRADPEPLQPQRVDKHDARTVISVGPGIVDHLGEDERVRVEIVSTGFAADVVWSDIPRSSGRVGPSVFVPAARPEQPAAPPAPPAETPPQPDLSPPDPAPQPPAPAPRRWLVPALAVALILVAAGVAWHYRADIAALFRPVPPPIPTNGDELHRLREELVRMMEAADGDPGRILDGGRRLVDSDRPDLREFGFRAIDIAATRGSASAQLEMGRLYDPRHFRPGRGGMDRANSLISAEWYRRAKDSGSSDAAAELTALCGHLGQPQAGVDEAQRTETLAQYCN